MSKQHIPERQRHILFGLLIMSCLLSFAISNVTTFFVCVCVMLLVGDKVQSTTDQPTSILAILR